MRANDRKTPKRPSKTEAGPANPAPASCATPAVTAQRIVIIGGGFSGATTAVQAVRKSPRPLAITVVEPRARVGPGLAYSTADPDYRLNGPASTHNVDPDDPDHFPRWCEADGLRHRDPQAWTPAGVAFIRRADFGRYLAASFDAHAAGDNHGSVLVHHRARALDVQAQGSGVSVATSDGQRLAADLVVLATGNAAPRWPAALPAALHGHPGLIEYPLAEGALQHIAAQARVLVLGAGLTALDAIATLLRQGHRGEVIAVSRHGLRPRPQAAELLAAAPPGQPAAAMPQLLDLLDGPLPPYAQPYAQPQAGTPTVRRWLRGLRERIAVAEAAGQGWQSAFDELRNVVWRAWPLLPAAEQRRFLRQLRPWYDVHRFRTPPQTEGRVREAERLGQVAFRIARLQAIQAVSERSLQVRFDGGREEAFGAVVNCAGFRAGPPGLGDPVIDSLHHRGWLQPDVAGQGFAVDGSYRPIGADGVVRPRLRLVGPLTAGTFGDPLGAVFIAAQVRRMLPGLWVDLQALRSPVA